MNRLPHVLWILGGLLLIIAYFVNLGFFPLIADEATRGLVALEMDLSGNYWVPTTNGTYYYNKPPFFNWIIIGLFKLFGRADEGVMRIAAVVPLFLFAGTLFVWVRKHLNTATAFLAAAALLSFGRMLIYDAHLAHIDIFYSWITFQGFIVVYHFSQKGNWLALYTISYALAAIAFLCKGLPTVLFQGFTLIGWFLVERKFWKLFSWQHVVGGLVFVVLVGGYFYHYANYNDPIGIFETLWDQSRQRTVADKAWYESVLHLFTFPFEHLVHLLPWSLLIVFCFRKGFVKHLWQDRFTRFLVVTFGANIPVYWLSPETYPRYLFMLYPMVFIVFSHAWYRNSEGMPRLKKGFEILFLVVLSLVALASPALYFIPLEVENIGLEATVLVVGFISVAFFYYKLQGHRLALLFIALGLVRLGFDWVVLPQRFATSDWAEYREGAIEASRLSLNGPLHLYNGASLNHYATFYIERERGEVLDLLRPQDAPDSYFIVYHTLAQDSAFEELYTFRIRYENRTMKLVKYEDFELGKPADLKSRLPE
ncbi:MAG: ArnT family glycosyltransferase [Salibacteraceae bacterium]